MIKAFFIVALLIGGAAQASWFSHTKTKSFETLPSVHAPDAAPGCPLKAAGLLTDRNPKADLLRTSGNRANGSSTSGIH